MKVILSFFAAVLILFSQSLHATFEEGKKAFDSGDYQTASKFLEKEVEKGNEKASFYLAVSYQYLGRYDEAEKLYLNLNSSAPVLYNLSIIAFNKRDYEKAGIYLNESAKLYGEEYFFENPDHYAYFFKVLNNTKIDSNIYSDLINFREKLRRHYHARKDDRNSKMWNIKEGDFNLDGKFTIRDLWSGFLWTYFYIGDWIHFHFLHTFPQGFSDFLELDESYYGGWLSGITSFLIWIIIIGKIGRLIEKLIK